jgi:hypothetical protein
MTTFALRVAGLVPELELALREDKLGPHIRWLTLVRPKVVIYRSRFHNADANDKARRNQNRKRDRLCQGRSLGFNHST